MFNTNFFFKSGKLSCLMDSGAGSSGKGNIGSFMCEHADNWQFACNSFYPQAGHWIKLDDGRTFFYQTFNSCAYQDKYEKLYLGPGAIIELSAFWRELEENKIPHYKIGIHPLVAILQEKDTNYERGLADFEGKPIEFRNIMKHGTTAHGVGACRARRILRRPDALYAKDIPELKEFLCDTSEEIMDRLDRGQAGFLEIAQGFQLSIGLKEFFPACTSRNVTIAAAFDDMMLPITYAGNLMINLRTHPIRINSNRYFSKELNRNLTWDEVQSGIKCEKIESPSGPGYDDQEETTWDEVTRLSGSPEPITEYTSVTKLPRRVFNFSKKNLSQAMRYNRVPGDIYLSINFVNYVDYEIQGKRGIGVKEITPKVKQWIKDNIKLLGLIKVLGTGPLTDDKILIP